MPAVVDAVRVYIMSRKVFIPSIIHVELLRPDDPGLPCEVNARSSDEVVTTKATERIRWRSSAESSSGPREPWPASPLRRSVARPNRVVSCAWWNPIERNVSDSILR